MRVVHRQTGQTIELPEATDAEKAYFKNLRDQQALGERRMKACTCLVGPGYAKSRKECTVHREPEFDARLSPNSTRNLEAAYVRGWTYKPEHKMYADEDDGLVADQFGQPL